VAGAGIITTEERLTMQYRIRPTLALTDTDKYNLEEHERCYYCINQALACCRNCQQQFCLRCVRERRFHLNSFGCQDNRFPIPDWAPY
jgi:hypothetical protein